MTDEEIRAICHELLDLIGETRTTQSQKLEQAVGQLVVADGVLAERLERAESVLRTMAVPGNGMEDTHRAAMRAYVVAESRYVMEPTVVEQLPGQAPTRRWWKLAARAR